MHAFYVGFCLEIVRRGLQKSLGALDLRAFHGVYKSKKYTCRNIEKFHAEIGQNYASFNLLGEHTSRLALKKMLMNPFPPRQAKTGSFVILLCLTSDDFTRQGRAGES